MVPTRRINQAVHNRSSWTPQQAFWWSTRPKPCGQRVPAAPGWQEASRPRCSWHMRSLEEIYKSWITLRSVIDSLHNLSSVKTELLFVFSLLLFHKLFFSGKSAVAVSYIQIQFHYWESAGVAALWMKAAKLPAASCSCSHFVQLGQVIMDFIHQHRIERNLSDSLLKLLHVDFFFLFSDRHILQQQQQQQRLRFWFRGGPGAVVRSWCSALNMRGQTKHCQPVRARSHCETCQ